MAQLSDEKKSPSSTQISAHALTMLNELSAIAENAQYRIIDRLVEFAYQARNDKTELSLLLRRLSDEDEVSIAQIVIRRREREVADAFEEGIEAAKTPRQSQKSKNGKRRA